MGAVWKNIVQMQKDGTLPEEAELDANAVTDWDDYNNIKKVPSTFVPKAVAKAPVKPKSKAKSKAQAEAMPLDMLQQCHRLLCLA